MSNSSIGYFTDNITTVTRFSSKLPKSIKLDGEWFDGVAEFQYPCTMFTVQEHENIIYVTKKMLMPNENRISTVYYKNHIPATNYDNIDQILSALNNIKEKVKFRYDEISKFVSVTNMDESILSLVLSPNLGIQLGFGPNRNLVEKGFKNVQQIYI